MTTKLQCQIIFIAFPDFDMSDTDICELQVDMKPR